MSVKWFGRSEQGAVGVLWSVYEAELENDYANGRLLASFLRMSDANLFIKAKKQEQEEGCPGALPSRKE